MKIIFLASNPSAVGGIQQYNKTLFATLEELGHTVKQVALKDTSMFSKMKFALGFILKDAVFRPDLAVCSHINFSVLCFLAKKFFGTRYTVALYGIDSLNITKTHRLFLKNAEQVAVPFAWTRENIVKQLPQLGRDVFILPNPVRSSAFVIKEKSQKLLNDYRLPRGAKVILTVARLVKAEMGNKGYDRVIEAMPAVLKEVAGARLLIVGRGDDLPRLLDLVKSLKLENNVFFASSVTDEELNDYYNLADVFAFPSKKEGFPAIVVLEALSCGVPVVCGSQPGSEEPMWKEVGIVVPPDDRNAIARALVNILSGKAPKKLYDRHAVRKSMLEVYGQEKHMQRVRDFLRSAAKTPGDFSV
jgi:glycosyltransferase involved in cell wall biosynthesis